MMAAVVEREGRVSLGALWFGFFGGPVAWSAQEIAAYAITAHFCFPRSQPLAAPAFHGTWLVTLLVTIALLAVSLAALWVAVRSWNETKDPGDRSWEEATIHADEGRAYRYLAFSGILLSSIFAALIIYNGIALFIVPICGQ